MDFLNTIGTANLTMAAFLTLVAAIVWATVRTLKTKRCY